MACVQNKIVMKSFRLCSGVYARSENKGFIQVAEEIFHIWLGNEGWLNDEDALSSITAQGWLLNLLQG